MNELLQWSPIATLVVVITAVIGQVLHGGGGGGGDAAQAAAQAATQAATQTATSITMAALKETMEHLARTLERVDLSLHSHERRLVTIETACRMRHAERRQEAEDAHSMGTE